MKNATAQRTMCFQFIMLAALLYTSVGTARADTQDDVALHYAIQRGDTLIHLGERHLVRPQDWVRLQRENNIADPYRLQPGSRLRIPARLLRQAPTALTLEAASGTVLWRPDTAAEWRPVALRQLLGAGTAIRTEGDSSALLRLADDSRILVSPNSTVILDSLRLYGKDMILDQRLRLEAGQAELSVNPGRVPNRNLRIDTPGAQTVVRGTRFRIGTAQSVTREETLQGAVGVTAGGREVLVARGKGTVASAGASPMAPVALLPAIATQGLPTRFEQLPMRFPMPRLERVESWLGQVSDDAGFDRILLEKTSQGSTLAFSDLPNGDYVLRVRGIDRFGLSGHDALHRFSVFARPFAPGINAPGHGGMVRDARVRFEWTQGVDIASYRLQIAQNADFLAPLHDATTVGTYWVPSTDLPAGGLTWRIASIDRAGLQGPRSQPATFAYKPRPGPVDPGRISTQLLDDTIRLELGPPQAGLRYVAVLSTRQDLSAPLSEARSDNGSLDLERPEGGSYYLGIGFEDVSDGTAGPKSLQHLEVPTPFPWPALILLIPLL